MNGNKAIFQHPDIDWETLVRHAHSLKGVARALGAQVLGDLAAEPEEAGKAQAGARIDELKAKLTQELHLILTGLARLDELVEADDRRQQPESPEATVIHLAHLLESRDTEAVAYLETFNRMLDANSDHAAQLAATNHAIVRYNFASTLQTLRDLSSRLDLPLEVNEHD